MCLATTGPGAVHLITGLYDAMYDNAPVLAITGSTFRDLQGMRFMQGVNTVIAQAIGAHHKRGRMTMERDATDRLEIRELIDNWALWRDAGDWERFRTVWAKESWIAATWFQGTGEQFLDMTVEGWNKGVSILHFLGGTTIELAGDRAYAQTKMTISQRSEIDGVECDVVCTGRFHDLLLREDGRWKMALRQPTYEKNVVQPVEPGASTRSGWPNIRSAIAISPMCRNSSATR